MSEDLDIINNPWVIAIVAGIVSTLIVTITLRFIFSRRDQREYLQRTASANKEIVYAIRSGISEGWIPPSDVIRSMISATARKYSVEESSMYDLDDISSELIKEVMDSSFISTSVKKDYCALLGEVHEPIRSEETISSQSELLVSSQYRQQLVLMMGVLVGAMTAMVAFFSSIDESERTLSDELSQGLLVVVPTLLAVLLALFSVIVGGMLRIKSKQADRETGFAAEPHKSEKPRKENSKKA